MTPSIVEPAEEHREQIARLLSTSVNFPLERALANAPNLRLADIRVAIERDVVVATAGEFRFRQWFGGRGIDCCGITRVATSPEHRAGGLATACTDAVLERARERGTPIASLFPAVLRPYRRMGFEIAGGYHEQRVPLDALPSTGSAAGGATVELADVDRDLAGIRDAYRQWIRHANGPVEPVDDDHWRVRVLTRAGDDTYRAVVVREDDHVTGFAAFSRVGTPGPLHVAFGVSCEAMFTVTPRAVASILAYFRGYRGLGEWLEWTGPASDASALLVPETLVRTTYSYDWMLRLLDVPAALEARGYPPIAVDAVFMVDDERWPGNRGPWRIEARDGSARVAPARDIDAGSLRPISIGVLSSMFTGHLSPHDAVRLGLLDADGSTVEAFAALFAGSDPWCPFFF